MARTDGAAAEEKRKVRLGVVADPGAPSDIAQRLPGVLPDLLSERVSQAVDWEVHVVREALPLDAHGVLPLLAEAGRRKPEAGWDMLVYLTDLPRRLATQPVVADLSTRDAICLISLPALGGLRLRHHVTRTLVYLVDRMHHAGSTEPAREAAEDRAVTASRRGRLLRRRTEWASPVREVRSSREDIDTSLALTGTRGRLRLLAGMVRNNRPWQLVPHLAGATAAAAGTAAFGIFYSSIWSMADALSPLRLTVISVLAIGAMVAWLLFYNHLWDSAAGHYSRKNAALYNAATLCTLTLGVACMYALLYTAALLSALTVIDSGYLASRLGHPAGFGDYATLAWLSCSMGIVAGALGSTLEDEQAIRQATYSRRERDRQAQHRTDPSEFEQPSTDDPRG